MTREWRNVLFLVKRQEKKINFHPSGNVLRRMIMADNDNNTYLRPLKKFLVRLLRSIHSERPTKFEKITHTTKEIEQNLPQGFFCFTLRIQILRDSLF